MVDNAFRSGAVAQSPAVTLAPSDGHATEGDLAGGVPATVLGPYWFHMIAEEILAVVAQTGITPDKTVLTQLRDAIQVRIDTAIAAIPAGTSLTLASVNEHLQSNPPSNEAATPAGVRAVRNALIGNAPADRDTLDELYDVLVAEIATIIAMGSDIDLATNNEHLQNNPPSTKAATPSGVRAVRDALIGGAPGALNTLNELAAALGDDANLEATLVALINDRATNADLALKANIAAPTLTGQARSSTPPDNDNSTRIATTGWIRANAAGGVGASAFFRGPAGDIDLSVSAYTTVFTTPSYIPTRADAALLIIAVGAYL